MLKILYKLKYNKEFEGDPLTEMDPNLKSSLINEDPVTCNLYFNKMVDVIMDILKSSTHSPFGTNYVKDFFKKVEFQHRLLIKILYNLFIIYKNFLLNIIINLQGFSTFSYINLVVFNYTRKCK